jgi:hypothetical protein
LPEGESELSIFLARHQLSSPLLLALAIFLMDMQDIGKPEDNINEG